MSNEQYIAEFNPSDGLPPHVVQKLNFNFRKLLGVSASGYASSLQPSQPADVSYNDLENLPTINGTTIAGNLSLTDIGVDDPVLNVVESRFITTSTPASTIPIGIQGYDPSTCKLIVDVNGLVLVGGVDYTVSGSDIVLTTPIEESNQVVHFIMVSVS